MAHGRAGNAFPPPTRSDHHPLDVTLGPDNSPTLGPAQVGKREKRDSAHICPKIVFSIIIAIRTLYWLLWFYVHTAISSSRQFRHFFLHAQWIAI